MYLFVEGQAKPMVHIPILEVYSVIAQIKFDIVPFKKCILLGLNCAYQINITTISHDLPCKIFWLT